MKQTIILLCCALLGGCIEHAQSGSEQQKGPQQVDKYTVDHRFSVWHDDKRNVTCWIYYFNSNKSISCLPDRQLTGVQ